MLDRMYSDGKYARCLSSLASTLMYHLRLKESDVFADRVRIYAREVAYILLSIC